MKINAVKTNFVLCLVLLAGQHGKSQGTFSNFDFESATPPFNPDLFGEVPISSALPGWTAYVNGTSRDRVLYNDISLGGPSVSLIDSFSPFPALVPIQGSYSGFLKVADIGQTGQIPANAMALLFSRSPGVGFVASFRGQNIPLIQLGSSGNNVIMAGDISMFAGQTGELRFGSGGGLLDDIQFSPSAIPEPGALAVGILGAVVWLRCLKRHKRTQPQP